MEKRVRRRKADYKSKGLLYILYSSHRLQATVRKVYGPHADLVQCTHI